jgi:hypothetical protein
MPQFHEVLSRYRVVYKQWFNNFFSHRSVFVVVVLCIAASSLLGKAYAAGAQIIDVSGVTGAQVNESLVSRILYVSPTGSDSNSGTLATAPLRTLTAAASKASSNRSSNLSTKIILMPGTYREASTVQIYGTSNYPIVIEAQTPGTAIISGSDLEPASQWSLTATPNVYSLPWTNNWGLTTTSYGGSTMSDVGRRRELVFVNGHVLTQVNSLSALTTTPSTGYVDVAGTYYVDETADKLYMRPSVDLSTNPTIEVGMRQRLIWANATSNIVIRGIVFQHSTAQDGGPAALNADGSNILIENNTFQWNNWTGFSGYKSSQITARGNKSLHNGANGSGGARITNVIFEDNETSYNNWRSGTLGGVYGWSFAGNKFFHAHGLIFRRHVAVGNQAHGIWFDTDHANILIDNVRVEDNYGHGIFIEANQGPIALTNSTSCNNGGWGLYISNTENLTVDNNYICNNQTAQIRFYAQPGGRLMDPDMETGATPTLGIRYQTHTNNTIISNLLGSQLYNISSLNGTTVYDSFSNFKDSYIASGNKYYNTASPLTSTLAFFVQNAGRTLDGWKTLMGTDSDAQWVNPSSPSDTTSPTVSITAPANAATVFGSSVTVSANASDNVGVAGVQFKLDGNNLGLEDTTAPYSVAWNTTTVTNASHTLTAVARDVAGNMTTASNVSVTVNNVVSPPPPPPPAPLPTATFSASPISISSGQFATLTWTTTNASSVSIDQGIGTVTLSGSRTVYPVTTTIYTLTATGSGGTVTKQATVNVDVVPPPPPPPPPPPTTKFVIGDRVQVTTSKLNIRSIPGGSVIGSQKLGALGTVTNGPAVAKGYTWWQINYDTGVDGWSVEDYLAKVSVAYEPVPELTADTLNAFQAHIDALQKLIDALRSLMFHAN